MKNLLFDLYDFLINRNYSLVEIFYEKTNREELLLENGHIEKSSGGLMEGIGIRLQAGDDFFYFSTTDFDKDQNIRSLRQIPPAREKDNYGPAQSPRTFTPKIEDRLNSVKIPPASVTMDEKVARLMQLDARLRKMKKLTQATLRYMSSDREITILSSKTGHKKQRLIYTTAVSNLISQKNTELFSAYEAYGGLRGYEVMSEMEQGADLLINRLKTAEKAKDIAPENLPVIISASAGGTLIHEAVGHSLEADLVFKGISSLADKKGTKIAADIVNIVDDATINGARGSYHFDDEGTPAQRTDLIKNGVLTGFMSDIHYAEKINAKSSGNGRRESFAHKPIPRMSNTLLLPNKTGGGKEEDFIKDMKRGILVKKVGGGQVDTATGNFIFEISEGYYVNSGKVEFPIKHAIMSGNSFDTLMNIIGIDSNFGFGIGTCGKDGQGVPVTDAQPSILIKSLLVGGNKQQK